MTSLVLSAICAVALGAASPSVQTDTTDVYVIDYVEVKDFNGTQLVGKTISTYNVNLTGEGSRIVRTHIIKTVLSGNTVKVATREMSPEMAALIKLSPEEMGNAVFFLNGARVSQLTFNYLDANDIAEIKTLKGSEAAEYLQSLKKNREYDGETAGRGVVVVTTKSRN
ncbi:MAG: hypothetical protein J6P69_02275 [Bacteroidales bacterium]|nr:hypothetical protein [Bacteroidales bacterium]MBP5689889.1 hypothetical protein [Bacteroidales bacterium]